MDLEDEKGKMDEYILKCLVKSGWYMGRNVDVSCYDDVLKEEGYVINKHAYDILKEWGVQIYILYAGLSGKIYMGIMDIFYLVGNNIEEFIQNMFAKKYEPIELELK